MAKKIAIANQKGGVGKTTTTLNLANGLQTLGKSVLVIDCDPQCNTTTFYGAVTEGENTLYDFYFDKCTLKDAIQTTDYGDIIPCDKALVGIEASFSVGITALKNFHKLGKEIKLIEEDYDYILMDTPPNLGFYMSTALIAADCVIIPITAEVFAIDGLAQMMKTINDAKGENEKLEIAGILLTKLDVRNSLDRNMVEELPEIGEQLGVKVFAKPIRVNQDVKNAQAYRKRLFDLYPTCNAATDYACLTKEIVEGN